MKQYILTDLFTLIPQEIYTPALGETTLREQFGLSNGHLFRAVTVDGTNAVLAFALPDEYALEEADNIFPFAVKLLEQAHDITSFNKVIFHYNKEKQLSHTIIYTGGELKLANSFRADSFESALYFLFLAIKQLQINPQQCTVMVCNAIDKNEEETITRFFKGVEKNNLDNLIQK